MKKKSLPVFFVGLLMCGCQMKEVINEYNVVPLPVTMSEQQGRFYLNSDVPIVVNASQEGKHLSFRPVNPSPGYSRSQAETD